MGSSKTTTGVTNDFATETDSDSVSVTSANSSRNQIDKEFHNDTANHSSSPLDSPIYAQGAKVLAHHNIRVYEAKVLQIEYKQKEWRFYVHYLVLQIEYKQKEWRFYVHYLLSACTQFVRVASCVLRYLIYL